MADHLLLLLFLWNLLQHNGTSFFLSLEYFPPERLSVKMSQYPMNIEAADLKADNFVCFVGGDVWNPHWQFPHPNDNSRNSTVVHECTETWCSLPRRRYVLIPDEYFFMPSDIPFEIYNQWPPCWKIKEVLNGVVLWCQSQSFLDRPNSRKRSKHAIFNLYSRVRFSDFQRRRIDLRRTNDFSVKSILHVVGFCKNGKVFLQILN